MIGLPRKAPRFADTTMRLYLEEWARSPAARTTWRAWRAAQSATPHAGPDGYVEVPDAIARILRDAVERIILDLEHRSREGDAEGDLGNDIAFLSAVRGKREADLDAGPRVGR